MVPDSIESTVRHCLQDSYGLSGELERLAGENLNYLLTSEHGQRYIAKIADEEMPPEVVEMEFAAMEHAVSAGFNAQLPRIIQNNHRKIETGIILRKNGLNRLRLLTFIDGLLLESMTDISVILLENLGLSLARYHLAMAEFKHPAARRSHRWNLVEAGQHRETVNRVECRERRVLLDWGFHTWQQVESRLSSLPWQFIHGDMNPENILVRGDRVTGLVDFGDSGMNPAVCDLAICLAYIMMDRDDPLSAASVVTRGYRQIQPLSGAELTSLYPLICGRLATTIAVATSRRSIDPDNPNWFGHEERSWRLLRRLRELESHRFPDWMIS